MHICQPLTRITGIMFSMLLAALTVGCASGGPDTYSGARADQSAAAAPNAQGASGAGTESDFAGVWQGTTLATCAAFADLPSRCNAEQIVTITLLQGPDAKLSGRYTCAYGNTDCYQENDTGKIIDVNITGKRMSVRVLMPDATSCIYTGINVNQTVNGGYTCYPGGGLIEEGSWQARRSY
jgi:hypothetical protein